MPNRSRSPKAPPIKVAHLFRPLDEALMKLLASLNDDDWQKSTPAKHWTVKDVAAHLLDGNLRTLSIQRDGYFGEVPPPINDYEDLVGWLNLLNADWVKASKRLSPGVLQLLHQATGSLTSAYYESLAPWDEAIFAVDWAGESKSYNWMHLAREYTEKWHHQQQIREAVDKPGIMTRDFFFPMIATYFMALPHTFRDITAPDGKLVTTIVSGKVGGEWHLERQNSSWVLVDKPGRVPDAAVEIAPELAWKLFSKNIRPDDVKDRLKVEGDKLLAAQVLQMVSVMA
ncbi:MAG: maleylpyruvate isomerase N-terminal domain-containing protein [Imperialibacter sp.]|uniref:maleylpyruvate isomerase N-terminal domain-containing protein n=1 Tax=Imperialibacter sp. TaxID=2038411 RepID=UPI0032EF9BCF